MRGAVRYVRLMGALARFGLAREVAGVLLSHPARSPVTAPVKNTQGFSLAKNKEDKQYYSVDTFQNAKVRH